MTINLEIRKANRADLPAIIALFAGDHVGGHGDTTDPKAYSEYLAASEKIDASTHQTLYVACLDGEVVGTFQTATSTSLSGRGSSSLVIEAVQHAIGEAQEKERQRCGSSPTPPERTRIGSTSDWASNAATSASICR